MFRGGTPGQIVPINFVAHLHNIPLIVQHDIKGDTLESQYSFGLFFVIFGHVIMMDTIPSRWIGLFDDFTCTVTLVTTNRCKLYIGILWKRSFLMECIECRRTPRTTGRPKVWLSRKEKKKDPRRYFEPAKRQEASTTKKSNDNREQDIVSEDSGKSREQSLRSARTNDSILSLTYLQRRCVTGRLQTEQRQRGEGRELLHCGRRRFGVERKKMIEAEELSNYRNRCYRSIKNIAEIFISILQCSFLNLHDVVYMWMTARR